MIITDVKIEVTEQMMFNHGLSRMLITGEIAVPTLNGKIWKNMIYITEEDFEDIENYFLKIYDKKQI
jgi:hypothetical protein